MKTEEWKHKYGNETPKKELLEKIMEDVGATIVKQNLSFKDNIVSGKCMFDGCDNQYEKTARYLLQRGGPFCDFCIRFRKHTDKLIKDYRKDVYDTIVSCEIDKDFLTIGMNLMATFQCGEKCSRCETLHEWSSTINKRIVPSKFGNCPFCSGNRVCQCVQQDEFRCYICKKIKDTNERDGDKNRCKLCKRSMNDGDKRKMIRYIWQRTYGIMKRDKHKHGDLSEQCLLEKYEQQEGKCYISGIEMALGTFHDWQISVERVDENKPYNNDNVVLICREFQHGCRQYSREIWDEMCALVLGVQEEDTETIDQMIREEIDTPDYELPLPPKPDHPTTNEDGTRFCKYCQEWKTLDEMAYKHSSNCKNCRKIRRDESKSTFHGRIHYVYMTAKEGHNRRKLEFTITEKDIENIYLEQHGRCFYSKIPLGFSGQYQMSLERIDPKKGYIQGNIALIVLGLNVADWTRVKHVEDERNGSSGWNREKLLWAVQQNPRCVEPESASVYDILKKLKNNRNF
jgi:hypothetical protein